MQKTALRLIKNEVSETPSSCAQPTSDPVISVADLEKYSRDWLFECEYRQHSPSTLAIRRYVLTKLFWFLNERKLNHCGATELRQFLAYVGQGHGDVGGRWGNPSLKRQVRPRTVHTYHGHLRTWFRWMVADGLIPTSPMERVPAPIHRSDQIQPFTQDQIAALLEAARRSNHPRRNEAIVLLLLDTGIRASELCGLKRKDLDLDNRRLTVLGKGNKHRTVYFGRVTMKALWQYLRSEERDPEEPVFTADRGARAGSPLTRSGLLQMIERLGKAAGIQAVRCSPHTFRNTFAVEWLRAGGNTFSLQQMLGHTNVQMTQRYVALAEADIEGQHRQFSPADRIKKAGK